MELVVALLSSKDAPPNVAGCWEGDSWQLGTPAVLKAGGRSCPNKISIGKLDSERSKKSGNTRS